MSLYLSEKHSCFENKLQTSYRLKRDLQHKKPTPFSCNHRDRRLIRGNLEQICPFAKQEVLTLLESGLVFDTYSMSSWGLSSCSPRSLVAVAVARTSVDISVIIPKQASLIQSLRIWSIFFLKFIAFQPSLLPVQSDDLL